MCRHKRKLAELKKKKEAEIKSDEDILNRLEELEIQEELQRELTME